jgi:hypothetical protein
VLLNIALFMVSHHGYDTASSCVIVPLPDRVCYVLHARGMLLCFNSLSTASDWRQPSAPAWLSNKRVAGGTQHCRADQLHFGG